MPKQSVVSIALKTPLEIRLGICLGLHKTSLLHRPDDHIDFTPICPPTFYNKIAPMHDLTPSINQHLPLNFSNSGNQEDEMEL